MANTAFDHASALTIPGSTTNNGLVRWGDTTGTSFGNITGITSDGSNITLLTRGEIRFSDADSSNFIALESPATVGTSYTMTLPAAVPSAADYLKVTSYSGGAGVLEWASVSADTNTTYLTSWVDSSANAILRLTPSSGSADDLTIVAGTNITLTPSGDNLTIDAAAGGATLSGSTNNTIVTVTGSNAMQGEAELTYYNGAFKIDYSGQTLLYIDSNTGASEVRFQNAGTDVWSLGMDTDGASNQKSHATDFAMYNGGTYGVVISGNGTTKFGIGTQAGIALSGSEIPDDGIQFPATQVANASANNLDDYEEGTFTPYFSDSSGGTGTGQHYHYQFGNYVKIGKMCWFQCRVSGDNKGGLSGAVYIKGLPFTSLNQTNNWQALAVGQGLGWATGTAGYSGAAYLPWNTTLITMHLWDGTLGTTALQYSETSNDGGTSINGCYMCTA